jgi:hypothetical protein
MWLSMTGGFLAGAAKTVEAHAAELRKKFRRFT